MKAVGKVCTYRPAVPRTPPLAAEEPFLFVKEDCQLIRVSLREIISLESLRDYVKITTSTQQIVTRQTLGYYEELLPGEQFLRIHRSFIVAKAKIIPMTESRINVPGQMLPIGRYCKPRVLEQLQVRELL